MEHIRVTYAPDAKADIPAMMEGVEPMAKQGIYINNVNNLILNDVSVEGQDGAAITLENIEQLES